MTVVVMTVGRTGSSLIAGMLDACGVVMTERCTTSFDPDSAWGYPQFEEPLVRDRNEFVLSKLCGGFKHQTLIDVSKLESDAAWAMPEIKQFVRERDSKYPIWGMKDPRLASLIRIWHPFLTQPRYIFSYRQYSALVASFKRGFPDWSESEIKKFILIQTQRILDFFADFNIMFFPISYKFLTRRPELARTSMLKFLGLDVDSTRLKLALSVLYQPRIREA